MLRLLYSIVLTCLLIASIFDVVKIASAFTPVITHRLAFYDLATQLFSGLTLNSYPWLKNIFSPTYFSFLCLFPIFTIYKSRTTEIYVCTRTVFISTIIIFIFDLKSQGLLRNIDFSILANKLFDYLTIVAQNFLLAALILCVARLLYVIVKYLWQAYFLKMIEKIRPQPTTN